MIEKEFRALLPLWVAVASAMLLAHAAGPAYAFLGGVAFLIGAAALGALSFGHEFIYGTNAVVLMLPVPRSRIWRAKIAVASVLIAALVPVALYSEPLGRTTGLVMLTQVLATVAAVGFAPWLAMIARSALGGAVFTASLAGMLFVSAQLIGTRLYGFTRRTDDFTITFMTVGLLGLSAAGLVLGWRRFRALELIDGRGEDIAMPFPAAPSGAAPRRRVHPILQLAAKELRLQQLSAVLAAIFVALYVTMVLTGRDRTTVANSVTLMIVLYTGILALVIGSLAGGEERQLGVHETQLLLPVSSARQWLVKIAASLGLAAVLTMALPLALIAILPPDRLQILGERRSMLPSSPTMLASLVTLGLYVSVVAGNGVRGLIASIPVGMTFFAFFIRVVLPLSMDTSRHLRTETTDHLIYYEPLLPRDATPYVFALVFGLFLAVVLRLGLTNYRWSDRSPLRLATHALIALATLTASFVLLGALGIR